MNLQLRIQNPSVGAAEKAALFYVLGLFHDAHGNPAQALKYFAEQVRRLIAGM